MTKLPARNVLDGNKLPKTTTGEMKEALGQLRDYLNDLFGEDSTDKETARLALGIDLAGLSLRIDSKASPEEVTALLGNKADKSELDGKADVEAINLLKKEIDRKGVPIGSIHYFATAEPPSGYLKADGSSVSRTTYRELFDAIGTVFGEGDGETTFQLPDLRGEFVRGFDDGRGADPGRAFGSWQVATAFMGDGDGYNVPLVNLNNATHKQILGFDFDVAPANETPVNLPWVNATHSTSGANVTGTHTFDSASVSVDFARSRPRNVALLACIKAFDAPTGSV